MKAFALAHPTGDIETEKPRLPGNTTSDYFELLQKGDAKELHDRMQSQDAYNEKLTKQQGKVAFSAMTLPL